MPVDDKEFKELITTEGSFNLQIVNDKRYSDNKYTRVDFSISSQDIQKIDEIVEYLKRNGISVSTRIRHHVHCTSKQINIRTEHDTECLAGLIEKIGIPARKGLRSWIKAVYDNVRDKGRFIPITTQVIVKDHG